MYTPVSYPDAGIYPINGSEEDYTFSASLGRYGNTLIPCYLALIDDEGYAYAIWYIVSGDIALSYENEQPVLSGEGTSYFGSTVRFEYRPATQGIGQVQSDQGHSTKVLRDGQLYIIYKGTKYNVQGKRIE
jgi:hypothetical protein